jgi:hypothetical protein
LKTNQGPSESVVASGSWYVCAEEPVRAWKRELAAVSTVVPPAEVVKVPFPRKLLKNELPFASRTTKAPAVTEEEVASLYTLPVVSTSKTPEVNDGRVRVPERVVVEKDMSPLVNPTTVEVDTPYAVGVKGNPLPIGVEQVNVPRAVTAEKKSPDVQVLAVKILREEVAPVTHTLPSQ